MLLSEQAVAKIRPSAAQAKQLNRSLRFAMLMRSGTVKRRLRGASGFGLSMPRSYWS